MAWTAKQWAEHGWTKMIVRARLPIVEAFRGYAERYGLTYGDALEALLRRAGQLREPKREHDEEAG